METSRQKKAREIEYRQIAVGFVSGDIASNCGFETCFVITNKNTLPVLGYSSSPLPPSPYEVNADIAACVRGPQALVEDASALVYNSKIIIPIIETISIDVVADARVSFYRTPEVQYLTVHEDEPARTIYLFAVTDGIVAPLFFIPECVPVESHELFVPMGADMRDLIFGERDNARESIDWLLYDAALHPVRAARRFAVWAGYDNPWSRILKLRLARLLDQVNHDSTSNGIVQSWLHLFSIPTLEAAWL